VKSTGLYPGVRVDTSATAAVGQAGGVLLTRTIAATGLDRLLSLALARWRRPLAVHDPGKIITDLALSLALGGDCLADLAGLRAEPGVYGRVASDPTVLRAIAALAAVLKAIDTARAVARHQAWRLAGEHAPDHGSDAKRLDADSRPDQPRRPPLGTQTATPPPLQHPGQHRPQRPPDPAASVRPGPLGRGCRRRHPQTRPVAGARLTRPPAIPTSRTIRNSGTPQPVTTTGQLSF